MSSNVDRVMRKYPGRHLADILRLEFTHDGLVAELRALRDADPRRFEWEVLVSRTGGVSHPHDAVLWAFENDAVDAGPPRALEAVEPRGLQPALHSLVDLPRLAHAEHATNAFDALDTETDSRLHADEVKYTISSIRATQPRGSGERDE